MAAMVDMVMSVADNTVQLGGARTRLLDAPSENSDCNSSPSSQAYATPVHPSQHPGTVINEHILHGLLLGLWMQET
jgi:hypothetical protein